MSRLSHNKRGTYDTDLYSNKPGALELEQKLRKEAEDKYRKTVQKLDQLQKALQARTEELEIIKKEKVEVEQRNEKLQFTINKLEQYLRKKSIPPESRNITGLSQSPQRSESSLADVAELEESLNDKTKRLEQEREKRIKAEERCKKLEAKLSTMGITDCSPVLQTSDVSNVIVDGELDF